MNTLRNRRFSQIPKFKSWLLQIQKQKVSTFCDDHIHNLVIKLIDMMYDILLWIFQFKAPFLKFLIEFFSKYLLVQVLFKIFKFYNFNFATWSSFAANESFFSNYDFLIEFGVCYLTNYFTLVCDTWITALLYKLLKFPYYNRMFLSRADKNSVRMELHLSDHVCMFL